MEDHSSQDITTALVPTSAPNYGTDKLGEPDRIEEEEQSIVFPLEPFRYLPCLEMLLPRPWTKIVSFPHLVVLLGCISSIAVLIDTIVSWKVSGCKTFYCQGHIVPVVFVGLCVMYFFATIQQYDAALQQKQKELQAARRALDERYKDMVQDLERFLSKSLETEVTLAEQGFESHRRDFSRFLEKYTQQLTDSDSTGGAQVTSNSAFLLAFCSFVRRWLGYFAECSIDPVGHPLEVTSSEEIQRCNNAVEVATVLLERLENTEVHFVSTQREKDKEDLVRFRTSWTNKFTLQQRMNALIESLCGHIPTLHKKLKDPEDGTTLPFIDDLTRDNPSEAPFMYRWVRWGRSESLGLKREEASSCLPLEVHLGCVTIILLSWDHIRLIMGFFMGIAVVVDEMMEFVSDEETKFRSILAESFVCLVCIAFILYEFLDMDIIAQLDAQLRELEVEQMQVLRKREQIMSFYTSAQELGDLWLHRTLPELELMKCFYEGLRDVPVEYHMDLFNDMDKELETLEQSTPQLSQWRGDTIVSLQKKKSFGTTIKQLVRKSMSSKEALALLPQCTHDIRVAFGLEVARASLVLPVPEKLKAIEKGSAVEYFSFSLGRWVPALVLHIDPETGLIELDGWKKVEPIKVRPAQPLEEKSACGQQ